MISIIVCVALTPNQINLPRVEFEAPWISRREVIVGMRPSKKNTLAVIFLKDNSQRLLDLGLGSDQIAGGNNVDSYAVGFTSYEVVDAELDEKPCRRLTLECLTKQKTRIGEISNGTTTSFWTTLEGKILLQKQVEIHDNQVSSATCVFSGEEIEITTISPNGKEAKTTMHVAKPELLDAQFKPMYVDDKVLLDEKEFDVVNPFKGTIDHFKTSITGSFNGKILDMTFKGKVFQIEGNGRNSYTFVSVENDLIKMSLTNNRYAILQTPPESRTNGHWKVGGN